MEKEYTQPHHLFNSMYIEEIKIKNLRVFAEASATFQYPGRKLAKGERAVSIPNLNLILGNNGAGKSSLLKAIGLAAMGPLASKFNPEFFVRRTPNVTDGIATTGIVGQFSWQDCGKKKPDPTLVSGGWSIDVIRKGDEEEPMFSEQVGASSPPPTSQKNKEHVVDWSSIYHHDSCAFFAVGYGSTRRVDTAPNSALPTQMRTNIPLRHRRINSLFEEGYSLVPLGNWLPAFKNEYPGRFLQVRDCINDLLPDGISFDAQVDSTGRYLFAQNGALVPFAALSDGCRAFIGWVADMLYHICFGCPKGVKLVDNCGIVLVDEIDLHLHPEWQRTVLPKLASTFPNLQFIVTTHSPIVVGTLQRENIWVCEPAPDGNGSVLVQKDTGVHGLTSDQILNTEYFGVKRLRAPRKAARLGRLAAAATRKTPGKALAFLKSLSTAWEDETPEPETAAVKKPAKRKTATKKK